MKKNCRNIKVLVATLTLSVLSCLAHQSELRASEIRRYDNFDNFNRFDDYAKPDQGYIGPAFDSSNFSTVVSDLQDVDAALDRVDTVLNSDDDSEFVPRAIIAQIDAKEKEIITNLLDGSGILERSELKDLEKRYSFEATKNNIINDNLSDLVAALRIDLSTGVNAKTDDAQKQCYTDLLQYLDKLEAARSGSVDIDLDGKSLNWRLEGCLKVVGNDYAIDLSSGRTVIGFEFTRKAVLLFLNQNFEQKPANYDSSSKFFEEAQALCRKYGEIKNKLDQFIESKGFIYRNFAYKIVGQVVETALVKNQNTDFTDHTGAEVAGIQFKLADFYKILDKIEVLREEVSKCKNEQEFRGLNGRYGAVLENVFVAYKGFMEYFSSMVETLLTPLVEFDPSDGTMPVGELETFSTNFLKKNTKDNDQTLLDALIFNQLFAVFPRRFFGETLDKYVAEFFKRKIGEQSAFAVYSQLTDMPAKRNSADNIDADAAGGYASTGFQYFRKLYDAVKNHGQVEFQNGTYRFSDGTDGYFIASDPLDITMSNSGFSNGAIRYAGLETAIFKIARALRPDANHKKPRDANYETVYVRGTLSTNFDNFVNSLKVLGENCTGAGKNYDPNFITSLENSKEFIVTLATLPDYFDFRKKNYKAQLLWKKKLAKYIMDNCSDSKKFDCLLYGLNTADNNATDFYTLTAGGVTPGASIELANGKNVLAGTDISTVLADNYTLAATDAANNVTSTVGDVIKEFMEGIQFFREGYNDAILGGLGELQAKDDAKTYNENCVVQLDGQGFKSIFEKYFYDEGNGQAAMKKAMNDLLSVDSSNVDGTLAQFKTAGFENYLNNPELYDRDFDNSLRWANNESIFFPSGLAGAKLVSFFNADVSPFQYVRYFWHWNRKYQHFLDKFSKSLSDNTDITLYELVNQKAESEGLPCIDSSKDVGDMLIFQAVDWVAQKRKNILNMAALKNAFDDVKNKTVKLYSKNAAGELSATETSVLDFYRNTGASSLKEGDDLNKAEVFETALGSSSEDLERAKRRREALEAAKANRKEQQRLSEERSSLAQQSLKSAHSKIADVVRRLYNDSVRLNQDKDLDRMRYNASGDKLFEELMNMGAAVDEVVQKVQEFEEKEAMPNDIFENEKNNGLLENKDSNSDLFEDKNSGLFEDKNSGLFEDKNSDLFEDKNSGLFEDKNSGLFEGKNSGLFEDKNSGLFEDKGNDDLFDGF